MVVHFSDYYILDIEEYGFNLWKSLFYLTNWSNELWGALTFFFIIIIIIISISISISISIIIIMLISIGSSTLFCTYILAV